MTSVEEHEHHRRKLRYEQPPYFLLGLGILLMAWGVLAYLKVVEGSQWFAWGGPILILISVSVIYTRRSTASTVLGTLGARQGQRVKLGVLAEELGMSESELRAAIVDLRAEGRVTVAFDQNTGEIMIGEPKAARGSPAPNYCVYCRYPLPPGASFCPSCGSSVR